MTRSPAFRTSTGTHDTDTWRARVRFLGPNFLLKLWSNLTGSAASGGQLFQPEGGPVCPLIVIFAEQLKLTDIALSIRTVKNRTHLRRIREDLPTQTSRQLYL
jgi:hypothetical protein